MNSRVHRLSAGEVLFHEGEIGNEMYVVREGRIAIVKNVMTRGRGAAPRNNESEQILAELGAGEFFGEMAILNSKPRTATAVALTDASVLSVSASELETMVASNPEISVRLLRALAARLDAADAAIEALLEGDPQERWACALVAQAKSRGQLQDDGSIALGSMIELANIWSVSLVEAAAATKRLARLALVRSDEENLVLLDLPKLERFAAYLSSR